MMQKYLVGALMASIFLLTFLGYAAVTNEWLDVTYDSNTSGTYQNVMGNATALNNQFRSTAEQAADNAPGGTASQGGTDQTRSEDIAQGSVNILGLVPATYNLVVSSMNGLAEVMHVPAWITWTLFSVIIIGITLWMLGLLSSFIRG